MKSFASDNYSGVHPEILEAVTNCNTAHQISYGDDYYTQECRQIFRDIFGDIDVYFTFNGTGANVVALKCCALPYQGIICAETAHIQVDECGAPVQATGSTLIPIKTTNGKLSPELIQPYLAVKGNVHHVQPAVISISQSTELGTVYSVKELIALCDFAHRNDMLVHMDGARISNAAVSLGVGFKDFTIDCGIDIMSFGGTKNGLMFGEAVLVFNEKLKKSAPYFHKQTAQLFSKNRFIAAQFMAFFHDSLWLMTASHANHMAKILAYELASRKSVTITQSVDANGVFAIFPKNITPKLQAEFPFYVWNEATNECRLMCSFDTTLEEIYEFCALLDSLLT